MAEDKDGEEGDSGTAQTRPSDTAAARAVHDALPAVESPPLSSAEPEPELELRRKLEPKPEPEVAATDEAIVAECVTAPLTETSAAARLRAIFTTGLTKLRSLPRMSWPRPPALPHLPLKPRQRRRAMLAVTMALAAGFGAVAVSLVGGKAVAPTPDRDAQVAIDRLTRQIAALKADLDAIKAAETRLAAVEAGNTADDAPARRPAPPAQEITGSIPPPSVSTPIPPPRPAARIAARVSRPAVVRGWTLRLARNGLFLVEGRGDIYQVVPGAPLPGVGRVQAIERQHGRWVVITPKGLIVSLRDRRYFE